MKKFLIIICAALLIGAGCSKTPKPQNNQPIQNTPTTDETTGKKSRLPEVNITNEQAAEFETVFNAKSTEANFKIYYPTFIPNNLKLNKESLTITDLSETRRIVTYNLSDSANSPESLVSVQEQINSGTDGITELDQDIPKDEKAEYLKGFIKKIETSGGSYYVLLFLKDNKTYIRISAKTDIMDTDTLSKIAESMR